LPVIPPQRWVSWHYQEARASRSPGKIAVELGMNYFAHGRHFIDDPYRLAGTAVPDWLNVSDRRVRVRSRHAQAWLLDADPRLRSLAAGVAQHHADDAWFHATTAFAELSWRLTADIRDLLGRDRVNRDDGFRPSFLGHILVEILLDATLIEQQPERLAAYYEAFSLVDAELVAELVNRMAPRPAERLARFIPLFTAERFLWDYADDGKLCYRLNQVLRRVGLGELPGEFAELLPTARRLVNDRQHELLTPDADLAANARTAEM
jgi:hypothetical protein